MLNPYTIIDLNDYSLSIDNFINIFDITPLYYSSSTTGLLINPDIDLKNLSILL
jgi:hypothetical protein